MNQLLHPLEIKIIILTIEEMKKIFLAGHNGMVGKAILKILSKNFHKEYDVITKSKVELNLLNQKDVNNFFKKSKPDVVIIAAAKVGGINANNSFPADFIYDNLMIESNLISASYELSVDKLLFLGSSCIYPKFSNQPIKEEALLSGYLEPTNEPYAIAKIAGIKLCESFNRQHNTDFRSLMPTNLYGPNDNFSNENSHVIPALLRKFHEAKIYKLSSVEVWGSGRPLREFLHVDDLANACMFILNIDKEKYSSSISPMCSQINVGSSNEISIKELAKLISEIVEFNGDITFNESMPDGAPRKLLDSSKLNALGWRPEIELKSGLKDTFKWYLDNLSKLRI